ncbi:MAG: GatB/YqeY domain-containing protein [Actinomycetota bacterium]
MTAALKDRLREEITTALKAGDKLRVATLRMLSAAITNREKELLHDLSDDELREMATREMKRRTEAMEAYAQANRPELADKERAEREILAPYAPSQLSAEEVDAIIEQTFAATGASGAKDLGTVMGLIMGQVKGRADGAAVQRTVKERLGG